ncbi:MAG TPA: integration host factor subunit alpha [Candidatus Binataceae bacterium]|nr:integration host factor subunit alpha [Candidatus Binataceae bacterium]
MVRGQRGKNPPKGLTKAQLVDLIYDRVQCSKKEASDSVELVFEIIKETLRRGGRVKVSGFGSFVVCAKRARLGRNPQTGTPITIKPRRILSFKASHVLKNQVNQRTVSPS